jgi:hypothetical protein
MGLPLDVINRRRRRRSEATARSGSTDGVDAQIAALLEGIEAEQDEHTHAEPSPRSPVRVPRLRRPRIRKHPADARVRAEPKKPKSSADGSRRTFAPKVVTLEPRRAPIRWVRDRAMMERAYYILGAVVSGAALGLACAWFLA